MCIAAPVYSVLCTLYSVLCSPPRRSHSYAGEKRLRTHKRQASNVSTGSDKDGSNTSSGSRTLERGDKIDRSVFTTDSDMPSSNPDLFVAELLSLLKCSNEVVGGQVSNE